jgi:hypothetical protein
MQIRRLSSSYAKPKADVVCPRFTKLIAMLYLPVPVHAAFNFMKNVQNYEARSAPSQSVDFSNFGSAGLGIDTGYAAWSMMVQAFYSESFPFS